MQTEKIRKFPIVLYGKEYWSGMVDWLRDTMLAEGAIDEADLDLFQVCDKPEEVVQLIMKHYVQISEMDDVDRRHHR